MRAARDGGQMNKTAYKSVSPPYVETFNSKFIKKVSYLNEKPLRVFRNFEIPTFYRYEHYMSISHMAIFVYMGM